MDLSEKYRPARFEQLWQGLDSPTLTVIVAEIGDRRLQTPALITGDLGSGKTTVARIIGCRAACERSDRHPYEPCLECDGCRSLNDAVRRATTWTEYGYFEIDCTEYTASQVREMVQREAACRPFCSPSGRWIICLDEVGRRDAQYQKTLLKVVENVRADIILCSATGDSIDRALRERCVLRPLTLPTPSQCLAALKRISAAEKIVLSDSAAPLLVTRLGGNPRRILKALSTARYLNHGTVCIPEVETALAMSGQQ